MNECTRCGGQVPAHAEACMHCGATFTNTASYQWASGITGVIIIGFIFWYLFTEL